MPGRKYYWFDTPDGEDLLKKSDLAAKLGFMVGAPAAAFDHCLNPQKNLRAYAYRAGAFIVPVMGVGVMFTVTSQLLCKHVPQIKPEYSYMLGGVAAGSVVGAAARSMTAGCTAGFYFGVVAWIARDIHENWRDFPTVLGNLPRTAVPNDDDVLSADYRMAPPLTLPPPAARPAKSPSLLTAYY